MFSSAILHLPALSVMLMFESLGSSRVTQERESLAAATWMGVRQYWGRGGKVTSQVQCKKSGTIKVW